MKEVQLHVGMESSDIDEAWVREHYDVARQRKTSHRTASATAEIDERPFNYGPVPYDQFFGILKNIVDAHVLQIIVRNNITCAEKDIKISLEMSASDWYGDSEPSVYILVDYKHRETVDEVVRRLMSTNKRKLTAKKKSVKKQKGLLETINKLPVKEREALLAQLGK